MQANNRILVGITLALLVSICFYLKYIKFMLICINFAIIYDVLYLCTLNINPFFINLILFLMLKFNEYLFFIYEHDSYFLLKIIIITQTSDIYQYLFGRKYGKHKIGWISQNKTYEGYIGGLCMTIITFIFWYCVSDIAMIYFLGIVSGFLSSLLKRFLQIKDYSNLLSEHGGFIDRIDSIILPIILLYK